MKRLSLDEARRIAVAAAGLAEPRPTKPGRAHLRKIIERLGLLQIDFVNVLAPAHHVIPFSRLGPYERAHFDQVVYGSGAFTEQWAHEACIVPMSAWPLLEYRRAAHRDRPYNFHSRKHPQYAEWVVAQVRERGPLCAADLAGANNAGGRLPGTWYRSQQRVMLEAHFGRGVLAVTNRLPNFARVFDLAERAIPAEHRERQLTHDEARTELLALAARACGIGTLHDLADYYRMRPAEARPLVARLVESGVIEPVQVDQWKEPAYLHRHAATPQGVDARALLSPFDPLVWFRPRLLRLFDFEYRIEIYTPAAQRRWGYYVLPFLLGDRLVARVDLKADRGAGRLLVLATHYEKGAQKKAVKRELAEELASVATWLGLERVSGLR